MTADPNITTIREAVEARELAYLGDSHDEALAAVDAVERELADLRAENERAQKDVAERMAVNVGLIRENDELKRKLAKSGANVDGGTPAGRPGPGNASGPEDAERRLREATDALRAAEGVLYALPPNAKSARRTEVLRIVRAALVAAEGTPATPGDKMSRDEFIDSIIETAEALSADPRETTT